MEGGGLKFPPQGYRLERGLMWPADDREAAAVVFDTTRDMDEALRFCPKRELAVQAGGNCGVWAMWLAERFSKVITFEPDPANFRALVVNTIHHHNILSIPAALGFAGGGWCDMDRIPGNAGAHQVKVGDVAPVMAIDSLNLPALDLLYLDIEGSEPEAIAGALMTIDKFKPVIGLEDKGLSERYGYKKGHIVDALVRDYDYRVVARPHRDVILVHKG